MNISCCRGKVKIVVIENIETDCFEVWLLVDPVWSRVEECEEVILGEGFRRIEIEKGFGKEYFVYVKPVSVGVMDYMFELYQRLIDKFAN